MKIYNTKRVFSFAVLIFCVLLFTGCRQNKTTTQRANVFEDSSEEESTAAPDDESNDELKNVEASVKDEKSSYEYHGDEIEIAYQYMAEGADSVGIMILCDGVATPFHTKENTKNQILQSVALENGKQKDIDLCFTPYGKQGETVSVEIVDIIDSDYDAAQKDQDTVINDLIQGRKYQVKYLSGIHITMKKNGKDCKKNFCEEYSQKVIPDKDKKNNSMFDTESLKYLNAIGKVNKKQSVWYTVKQGESLDIDIRYFGSASGNILTSVYVDGKLYPAFHGDDYVQCPVDDKKYTIIKGKIDTSDLAKGRHTVFGVCGNTDYNDATCFPSFVVEVK